MDELYFGVPHWAWFIIIMQFIIGYWQDRHAKQSHSQYTFIMKELRPDVYRDDE